MAKIVIDARFYGTENTGLGRYTTNILTFLPKHCQHDTLYVLLRKKYYDSLSVPSNCHKILADIPHYSVREQLELPRRIDGLRADCVYALHFNVPVLMKTPYVVTIHDLIKSHFGGKDTSTHGTVIFRLKRWGYDYTMRHTVTHARAIITPSNTVKNDILALYGSDPTHIHPVAEAPDDIFRNAKKGDRIADLPDAYYLYVGNAYPHKNIPVLCEMLENIPHAELVMVTKPTPYVEKIINALPDTVKKRITLLDSLSDDMLVSAYSHAQALITPSLMEGYGLPGLEALMVGTPVIASNIPAFREVYGNNVTYFDPRDSSDLVRAMGSVGARSSRPIVCKRTWDDVARACAEVLHESCARI